MNDSTATEINSRYNTKVYNGHLPPVVKEGKAELNTLAALQAFTFAHKNINSKTTRAILLNANISFNEGFIGIEATDLESSIKLELPCDTPKSGAGVLVPTGRILSILKNAKSKKLETVTLEVVAIDEEIKLKVTAGKNSYTLNTMDPEEFPEISSLDESIDTLQVPMETFNEAARRVIFAVAIERGCYALNGIYLSFKPKKIVTVGTDGKRLSMSEYDYKCDSDYYLKIENVIIPPKFLSDASGMFNHDHDVTLQITEGRIALRGKAHKISKTNENPTGYLELSHCLIEGNFPKFRDVIPKDCDTIIEIDRKKFIEAIKDAATMTSEEHQAVHFNIDTETNEWVLSSGTPEAGKFEGRVDIEVTSAPCTCIAFDPRFLMDYLKKDKDAETIRVEMKGLKTPGMFYGSKGWTYLCSPINLE